MPKKPTKADRIEALERRLTAMELVVSALTDRVQRVRGAATTTKRKRPPAEAADGKATSKQAEAATSGT